VLHSLSDGVVVADRDGNLLDWNPAALRMHGFERVEEVRRHVTTFQETCVLSRPGGGPVPIAEWPIPRLIRGEPVSDYVLEVRRLDTGGVCTIRYNGVVIADPEGGQDLLVLTLHDVSAEHRLQDELQRTAGLLHAVVHEASDAVFVKDRMGRYLLCNEACASFLDKAIAEVVGRTDLALFDPDSAAQVMERDRRVMQSGRADTQEEQLTAAGVTRTYLATKAPYRDAAGNVLGLIGISRDISDWVRDRQALRSSQERLQLACEAGQVGIFDWDVGTGRSRWSRQQEAIYGLEPGGFSGLHAEWERYVHPDDLGRVNGDIQQTIERQKLDNSIDYRILRPDGTVRWISNRGRFYYDGQGRPTRIVGTTLDITDRKRVEEALRESDKRLRLALAAAHTGVWEWDLRTNALFWSPEAGELLGTIETVSSEAEFRRCVHPDDWDRLSAAAQAAIDSRGDFAYEYRIVRPDGEIRWARDLGRVECDHAGQPVRMIGTVQDITDAKRAAEELRSSRQMLQLVLDNLPGGVFWKDRQSRFLGCNRSAAAAFGDTPEGILGKTDAELLGLTPEQSSFFLEKDREVMDSGLPQIGILEPATFVDGTLHWLETTKIPLPDAVGNVIGVLGNWQDVTERKRLEEQFHHAQKMDAIGRLAGGVAHDFNNLLTIINGYCELLLESGQDIDRGRRDMLEAIRDAGQRAARLTKQLLSFGHRAVVEPKPLNLNTLITSTEQLLRRLVGETIELTISLDAPLSPILADAGQWEQVLMNLTVNARDAMPTGGRMSLSTRRMMLLPEQAARLPGLSPGPHVELTVSDSGCGIRADVLPRIFEPFYTTKGVGKGTGLGLPVVHGVVQQTGGRIDVESVEGQGTTFRILLPAVQTQPEPETPEPEQWVHTGSATVLLVEDEDAVRAFSQRALESRGYRVLSASNGREALRISEEFGEPIDLLITDVVMPDLGGRAVAEALRAQRPTLRVLYVSGYTDDAVVRHGVQAGIDALLSKPFQGTELVARVEMMLQTPK
jgi:two-component system, cell cycle sensor histidine kinase and response regulator CckA